MHAIEWIAANARYKRTITAVALRVNLKREHGHCTWCDEKIKVRSNSRWCSAKCRDEGYIRFGFWRGPVRSRDKGICAICQFDCLAFQQRLKSLVARAKGTRSGRHHPYSWSRIHRFMRTNGVCTVVQPYEVDHIIPVIEGGGCCGLDNLRTLCFVCHRQQTADLAKRRAEERRDAKRPLLVG